MKRLLVLELCMLMIVTGLVGYVTLHKKVYNHRLTNTEVTTTKEENLINSIEFELTKLDDLNLICIKNNSNYNIDSIALKVAGNVYNAEDVRSNDYALIRTISCNSLLIDEVELIYTDNECIYDYVYNYSTKEVISFKVSNDNMKGVLNYEEI